MIDQIVLLSGKVSSGKTTLRCTRQLCFTALFFGLFRDCFKYLTDGLWGLLLALRLNRIALRHHWTCSAGDKAINARRAPSIARYLV